MLAAKQLFSIVALAAFLTVASAQVRSGCARYGTVQDGDTCDKLSAREGVSTFQLAYVNKGIIDPQCRNLSPGQNLCLAQAGEDCATVVVVQSGDYCQLVANAANIPLTTLFANNPNIYSNCTNIYPDEVLCVASDITNYS